MERRCRIMLSMSVAPRLGRWIAPAITLVALAFTGSAHAEPVEKLAKELKENEDFRVRTQAALSLGKSGQTEAVAPLCEALGGDSSDAVRGASAAALGKLGKQEGLPCLEARKEAESSASVKSQIEKSIGALSKSKVPPGSKYYVSVGKVNNKTQRSEVDGIVRDVAVKKLGTMSGYAVAPKGEASGAAKKIIDEKSLKGFQLLTTVDAPVYEGDKLTVAIKVTVTTYPGSSILAGFNPTLTQSGVSGTDKASEDELVKMAVERALESLEKVAPSL